MQRVLADLLQKVIDCRFIMVDSTVVKGHYSDSGAEQKKDPKVSDAQKATSTSENSCTLHRREHLCPLHDF